MPMPRARASEGPLSETGLPSINDVAGLWCIEAGRDVHQRGFTRSILAEKSVDLPGLAAEFRVIQNDDAIKGFPDSLKSEAAVIGANGRSYF